MPFRASRRAHPRPPARRSLGLRVAAVLALGGLLTVAGGVLPATATDRPVLEDGAVTAFDLTVDDGGDPVLRVRRGERTWEPAAVVFRADGDRAALKLPDELPDRYRGLLAPGGTVFQLPGTSAAGLPALGWGAPASGEGRAAAVELTAGGPGRVLALTDLGEGRPVDVHLDSALGAPAVVDLPAGAVATPTWIFERPGSYLVTAVPSIVGADAGTVAGPAATYRIEVTEPTPIPAAPVAPAAPIAPAVPAAQPSGCEVPGLAPGALTAATGHYDFGVQVEAGRLRSRVKDDQTSPATWRDPASVLFQLGDPARTSVPAADGYSFLGAPGSTVWTIGQTQQDGVPWLGWNTQHPSAVAAIDGATTWTLNGVDGPGDLFVYQTGSFGALTRVLGSAAGWPRSLRIPANVHGHGNWSFTEPGTYRITTTHTATLRSGATASSRSTLFVQVGACAAAEPRPGTPLSAGQLIDDDALGRTPRGGVVVDPRRARAGATVSVAVPGVDPGTWLMPVASSSSRQLGWTQVSATGHLAGVVLPRRLAAGRHRIAVYDSTGTLRGWGPVTVPRTTTGGSDEPHPDDGGRPAASSPPPAPSPGSTTASSPGLGGAAAGSAPPRAAPRCAPSLPSAPSGGALPSAPAAGSASTADPVGEGHLDFGAHLVDGALVPKVKDDRRRPPAWIDPTDVRFVLGATAEQQVPRDPAYSFMGEPGATVWMMPQTQVDGVPWLGWNTQDESVRSRVEGAVRFTLDRVSGPGRLAVYLTDSFGGIGERTFGNAPGFPASFDVPVNVHAHGNWVFTAPGSYAVTITQSATLSSGQRVSGTATLSFSVGDDGTARALPRAAPGWSRTAAESLADCVLPATGASRSTAVLLPLGGLLVLLGAGVLLGPRARGLLRSGRRG